nr:DEAD/DEAH box helicase [Desulfobulbaceae bacterium]
MPQTTYAPGMRLEIRGEEWVVKRVNTISGCHSKALTAIGISELVRDKESIFLDGLELDHGNGIKILDPADIELKQDNSERFIHGKLFVESLLRQTPPIDNKLYLGHQGAVDDVPFQLDPALQALELPRQRILIADAVGLGKTIEIGILLSELIRRGRGKRILVVTLKSLMAQFQKELWHRFTIPLVRLDSSGLQKVRNNIPTNANPFSYYDKTIISIDTLKNDSEYRVYLENCHWDIVVIDEAHNVAERGNQKSQRAKVAKLLAEHSESMILASATPFDGNPRSFASLMNMLDPTAIADPENYGPEDIKGLYLRRFKKDINEQVKESFKERTIRKEMCIASSLEESVYEKLSTLKLEMIDRRKVKGQHLFKTVLEKSMFSSPAACLKTVNERLKRQSKVLDNLKLEDAKACARDIEKLKELSGLLQAITAENYGKYQSLLSLLKDKTALNWTGKSSDDRLVIFTEHLETLTFLKTNLQKDLNLNDGAILELNGSMSDIDQMSRVQDFGDPNSKVRLLIASDVASEGINLHYLSHKMIHFDIPWSLMTFQQRNGRIDRYGQEREPLICYLLTESSNENVKDDNRNLEILIKKDQQAQKSIGDPSALGGYDVDSQEQLTAKAMEGEISSDEFEKSLEEKPDFLDIMWGEKPIHTGKETIVKKGQLPRLFKSDWDYFTRALTEVQRRNKLQVARQDDRQILTITLNDELKHLFKNLPKEIVTKNGEIHLCAHREYLKQEIKALRNRSTEESDNSWLQAHLLWENHPLMDWISHKASSHFRRGEAPVLTLPTIPQGESWFLIYGMMPNKRGLPVVQDWFAVYYEQASCKGIKTLEEFLRATKIDRQEHPNSGSEINLAHLLTKYRSGSPTHAQQARAV